MNFLLKCAALAAACCSMGVTATFAAPAAQPPSPKAAASAAGKDDPAKVAAARQFIVVYHPHTDPRDVAKRLDESMPRMLAMAKQQNPKGDAKKFMQERRAAILDQANKMLDLQAHVLSRHFTLAELKQLTALFGSPLARKLQDESPKIQREIMLSQPLNMGLRAPPPGAMQTKMAPPPGAAPAPHK